jgi:hypothetical protein
LRAETVWSSVDGSKKASFQSVIPFLSSSKALESNLASSVPLKVLSTKPIDTTDILFSVRVPVLSDADDVHASKRLDH